MAHSRKISARPGKKSAADERIEPEKKHRPSSEDKAMDHIERTRHEFGRQAANFASSAPINDEAHVRRLIDPIGRDQGKVLDLACGPGIVTVALAQQAREVAAFDLTPE